MKPTPQISQSSRAPRRFPLTDYAFQATRQAPASSAAVLPQAKTRAFHKVSSEFFGAETSRAEIAELSFFLLIAGVAAWPIMSMLACLAWMRMVL